MSVTRITALACAILASVMSGASFGGIEEILVTTRRRAEDLETVPITIQALSAKDLEAASITRLSDLANATPGLYIETFNAGQASQVTMRGLAVLNTGGFDLQANNNVGMFIDGVFQTNRNNRDIELLELERVEIVKGPASALYGRSSFAGSINYVTRPPGDKFEARVGANIGSDEDYGGSAMVGGPIAKNLKGRLAFGYSSFDGTFHNVENPGDNLQGARQSTANGSLLWEPLDRLAITLSGLISNRREESSGQYLQTFLNCGTGTTGFTYFCGTPEHRDTVAVSPLAFGSDTDAWATNLKAEYSFDSFKITSFVAFTHNKTDTSNDATFTPGGALHAVCATLGCAFSPTPTITRFQAADAFNVGYFRNHDISAELRIQSNDNSRLTWLAGVYYFYSQSNADLFLGVDNRGLATGESFLGLAYLAATPDPAGKPNRFSRFDSDGRSIAVFGSVGYRITDRIRATVELRWENEKKDLVSIVNNFAPGVGHLSKDWGFFTPRVTLDYQVLDPVMIFASAARGVHAGGFNPSFPTTYLGESTYDEEQNWTYELGAKTTWFDRRLIANASLFYTQWDDLQIAGRSQSTTFPASIIRNTGKADSKGVDLGINGSPTDWATLGVGYTYSRATFGGHVFDRGALFACAPDICTITADGADVSGNRLPRSPEHQVTTNITFNGQLFGDWKWFLRTDFNYTGNVWRDTINKIEYGERKLVNARFGVERGPLSIALWGRNLFDDEYVTAGAFQPRTFTSRAIDWTQGEGRRYGITGTYRFGAAR